jgi:hypothetical protein
MDGGVEALREGVRERRMTAELDRAMPLGGSGGGRHGSDLGMTSVARHSETRAHHRKKLWRS